MCGKAYGFLYIVRMKRRIIFYVRNTLLSHTSTQCCDGKGRKKSNTLQIFNVKNAILPWFLVIFVVFNWLARLALSCRQLLLCRNVIKA